jgi:adenosylhomocysteine nucleosidase
MRSRVQRIAIFAALQWECRAVLRALAALERGRIDRFTCWRSTQRGRDVSVVKTGVGIARAGAAAAAVDLSQFDLIVSAGCAGGLRDDLAPGDLVIASTITGAGASGTFNSEARYRAYALEIARTVGLRVCEGAVLCSAAVLATADAKRAACENGAVAVEMEGAPIAAGAAAAGVPFLSVRAVLDAVEHDMVFPPTVLDPDRGTLRPLATAAYLTSHPRVWPALPTLRHLHDAASDALVRFFSAWLRSTVPTAE